MSASVASGFFLRISPTLLLPSATTQHPAFHLTNLNGRRIGVFFGIKATRQMAFEPIPMPIHEVSQFHVFIGFHLKLRQARRWFNAPLYQHSTLKARGFQLFQMC